MKIVYESKGELHGFSTKDLVQNQCGSNKNRKNGGKRSNGTPRIWLIRKTAGTIKRNTKSKKKDRWEDREIR